MKKKKKDNKKSKLLLAVAAFGLAAWWLVGTVTDGGAPATQITVYKTPTCGCCGSWVNYLVRNGYDVDVKMVDSLAEINEENGIARDMQSCHVAVIGDYFVSGHVPTKVIEQLLEEKPDIDGITLPDMPSGTPGMPGLKNEPWVFYGVKDGQATEFVTL